VEAPFLYAHSESGDRIQYHSQITDIWRQIAALAGQKDIAVIP